MTTQPNLTVMSAAVAQASVAANERLGEAEAALLDASEAANRLHLCRLLIETDLPPGALVEIIDWAEESNGDGTFDIDLGDAYSADGEDLGPIGGHGAIPAGRHTLGDGATYNIETDWDIFLADAPNEATGEKVIAVDKVYDWISKQGWATRP